MAFKFSFAAKFNTTKLFDIDTSGFEYVNLEAIWKQLEADYAGDIDAMQAHVIPVRGLYINKKSQFADRMPCLATDSFYVNLPEHMLDQVDEILRDSSAIRAINNGEVGFTVYPYEKNFYKGGKITRTAQFYSIRWVDIEPSTDVLAD